MDSNGHAGSLSHDALRHLWLHFTGMGDLDADELADHRPRRGLLSRGRPRQALSRRARRPLLRERRLQLRRRDGRGGRAADARAAVRDQLDLRPPALDRAGDRAGAARARRHQPRVLRERRLRGGRGRLEARPPVPQRARRAALEGDRAPGRLPRHDDGRALDQRLHRAAHAVRAARARRAARVEHEQLPAPAGRERGGVHELPARRARADDRPGRPGDGRDGDHGAGPERGRLVHAARRLLGRACASSATATASCCARTR